MYSITEVVTFIVGITAAISGTGLNIWIVAVNALDWRKVGSLSLVDLIMSFIGLVNTIQQVDITLDIIFTGFMSCGRFAGETHLRFLNVLIGLVSCNLWSTVWLSTYYCCRIVSFSNGILFRIKTRIPTFMVKLLVFSVIGSICITVPSFWNMNISAESPEQNGTHGKIIIVTTVPYKVTMLTGTFVPLLLALIPTGLTLSSLWRHTRRMKNTLRSSSQTKAHITASLTMVLLLSIHGVFCAASVSIIFHSFNTDTLAEYFPWYFVYFYTTIQAMVLINGNSKLKKAGKDILMKTYGWCGVICPCHAQRK